MTDQTSREPEMDSRKLTAAEKRRLAEYRSIVKNLETRGYVCSNLTVSVEKANALSFAMWLPFGLFSLVPFFVLYGMSFKINFLWLLALYVASFTVHEGIHGLAWGLFNGFRNIEFGFIRESMTPYCTCRTPQSRFSYLTGSLMPFLILGIVPAVYGLCTGSMFWMLFGNLSILSAGGDLLICSMIFKAFLPKDCLLLDHPTEVGLSVFGKR